MEVLEGTTSGLLANLAGELILSFKNKHHVIREKKERLEELLVTIHSVIDATRYHHVIRNKGLHKWLKNLKETADQVEQALLLANRHEKLRNESNRRNEPPESSSQCWDKVLTPLSFAKTFGKKLFPNKDDTAEKLTAALNKAERACRNTELFLKLLKLETRSNSYLGLAVKHARLNRNRSSGLKKKTGNLHNYPRNPI